MEQKKRRMLTVGKAIDAIEKLRVDRERRKKEALDAAAFKFDSAEVEKECKIYERLSAADNDKVRDIFVAMSKTNGSDHAK